MKLRKSVATRAATTRTSQGTLTSENFTKKNITKGLESKIDVFLQVSKSAMKI